MKAPAAAPSRSRTIADPGANALLLPPHAAQGAAAMSLTRCRKASHMTMHPTGRASVRAHSTPDPDLPEPKPSPVPDDVPSPVNAPVEEPKFPEVPIKAARLD